ncbi:MAG: hypothetical protein BMS9Abin36_0722 [Gammaproteobacteria bacterium]|nr:MAG: hypothetical protein BMS9Abin36_0722 [Gammaproteobacteria bacterium]
MLLKKTGILILAILLSWPAWAGAPDIMLKGFDGQDRNVNEIIGKGKWVVAVVWAHDCHICNAEINEMVKLHRDHKDKDLVVLGISVDGYGKRKLAKGFVDKHNLNFTNLIAEPDQAVMMKFGAGPFVGTPTYYVYSPEGEIMAKNVGPVSQEDIESFLNDQAAARAK